MKRKKNIAVVHCSGGAKRNVGIDFAALPKDCNQILEQYPVGIVLAVVFLGIFIHATRKQQTA